MKNSQKVEFRKIIITFWVFGVRWSYLVCIEIIRDDFRKIKKNRWQFFFSTFFFQIFENFPILTIFHWNLINFDQISMKNSQNRKFFKNREKKLFEKKLSSKIYFFLKTSPIISMHTKYEGITPKTQKVMMIFRENTNKVQ